MKKIYVNIDQIDIRGGVDQLTDVVKSIDVSLQSIADKTDALTGYLVKCSASNKGKQFEKVVKTSLKLRDELFQASLDLNEMQNQIVAYQNKIYRFEDMPEMAQAPNPYMVSQRKITTETSGMQFNRSEMIELIAELRNYREGIFHDFKSIIEKKNEIGSVWRDHQYVVFSEFIDEVAQTIAVGVKEFDEYMIHLEEKIKELD